MKRPRFLFTEFLIVAPLVVVTLACAAFLARELPRMAAAEKARVMAEYKAKASAIKDGEAPSATMDRGDRKRAGTLGRGSWGVEDAPGGRKLVWYRPAKAGEIHAAEMDAVPVRDTSGPYLAGGAVLVAFFLLFTNIGLRRFRRFMQEREDFMAATAHDLATPIAGLRRTIGVDDDEARNLVERLSRLALNLRTFLRLGGKAPEPDLSVFDLREAYAAAYAIFREDFRDAFGGEDLPVDDGGRAFPVRADRSMTEQAIWNVLSNELKYAAPYGGVSVRFSAGGGFAALEFRDLGKGLSRREMRKVFDRCYRAHSACSSGKGGFGIGLCTARESARAMGGDLTVAANSPRGCVFTLKLVSA